MAYQTNGKDLIKDGMIVFTAPCEILQKIEDANRVYVLFKEWDKSQPEVFFNSNVYCVLETGQVLWKIEPVIPVPDPSRNFYSGFSMYQGKHLKAYSVVGLSCLIDKETGKILSKQDAK